MRTITTGFRNSVENQANTELMLIFALVQGAGEPIRIVTEDQNGCSVANGKIVNYNWNGALWLGCPFILTFLSDDDKPPTAKFSIQNVDRRIGQWIKALPIQSPQISFFLLKYSEWVAGVYDSNNALSPSGTPTVEETAAYLFLRNVSVGDDLVTADVGTFDIANEPCPYIRTTQDRCPGLAR